MTGIQALEGVIHTPSRLRENALRITRTFGPLLSAYPGAPHSGLSRNELRVFPIIESSTSGQKGRAYNHGLQIPLSHGVYEFLEIGLSQSAFEEDVGHTSLLLRLVPWKNQGDFANMPRLCSRDSYAFNERSQVYAPLTHEDTWADFSSLWIDRKKTYELVKGYLDKPDTRLLGEKLKEILLKLGLVNLLELR